MQAYVLKRNLRELVLLFLRHRELTWAMTKRYLVQGHAGQALGFLWALLHPLIQVGIYVVVFSLVFRGPVDAQGVSGLPYSVFLLAGLIPWLGCAGVLLRSPGEIVSQANLVKQIMFPVEVLPMRVALAGGITLSIHLFAVLCYVVVIGERPSLMLAALLPLWLSQVLALVGLAFLISSVSVFIPDLGEVLQVFVAVGLFLAPILYTPDFVPEPFRYVLYVNPFTYLVFCYQDVFFHQRVLHPEAWFVWPALSALMLLGGYAVFRRSKALFGNAL